jgi:hypothetical protein
MFTDTLNKALQGCITHTTLRMIPVIQLLLNFSLIMCLRMKFDASISGKKKINLIQVPNLLFGIQKSGRTINQSTFYINGLVAMTELFLSGSFQLNRNESLHMNCIQHVYAYFIIINVATYPSFVIVIAIAIAIAINPLTAGHENIWAGFKCPQCYARVNMMM